MAADAPPANKSQNGKKIGMKLIKKKASRTVTFSKRRASLFRKASELATLCSAHLALMIFSPGGKIYSFGHPSVGAVIERYEASTRNIGAPQQNHLYRAEFMRLAAVRAEKTLRLKMELQQAIDDVQVKKDKIKMLDMVWEKERSRYWWNVPVKEMSIAQCKELEKKLVDLKMELDAELKMGNQAEDKDLTTQATPGKMFAPRLGDLTPNHSSGALPNNLVAGWINSLAYSQSYMPGPSNAASGSTTTNFQGSGFYNFGGGTSSSASMAGPSRSTVGTRISRGLGPNSYGVGPNHTNFNNFPF